MRTEFKIKLENQQVKLLRNEVNNRKKLNSEGKGKKEQYFSTHSEINRSDISDVISDAIDVYLGESIEFIDLLFNRLGFKWQKITVPIFKENTEFHFTKYVINATEYLLSNIEKIEIKCDFDKETIIASSDIIYFDFWLKLDVVFDKDKTIRSLSLIDDKSDSRFYIDYEIFLNELINLV